MSMEVQLYKKYEGFTLDVVFSSDSRRIGILGASGGGKSLTLKCLAGILNPDSGFVVIDGRRYYDAGKRINQKPQQRKIGYLFQNYALFPSMTVEKNIGIAIKGRRQLQRSKVKALMERFQILELAQRFPAELSGGEQQRTALARILASEPGVILLDEPFSALDVFLRDQLQQELLQILDEYPGTVIMVSHSRDEIYRFSDEVLVMDGGRIISSGNTKEVFEAPRNTTAARLTGCKNIAAARVLKTQQIAVAGWDMELSLTQTIPAGVTGVAIRAHEFRTEKQNNVNYLTFPVLRPCITEDLFEYSIAFYPGQHAVEKIQWKVGKEALKTAAPFRLPAEIYLPEEKLLLLAEQK